MAKDINKKPFDETTVLKLDIFRECFREWLPVFIHEKWTEDLFVFDLFAGSGKDSNGVSGSPLVLLEEAKGFDRKFCGKTKKPIQFLFNESLKAKSEELKLNVSEHLAKCEKLNKCGGCIYDVTVERSEFKTTFQKNEIINILEDRKKGKFLLLDQYGFSQIDDQIFGNLISYPKTDFIFFITSSFIKRFQEHPSVQAYFNTSKISFDETKPRECHRIISDYFRSSVPEDKEYYLHHFTIQKEGSGNYYGLIFGSNHTLGMEKFLKVCWQKDPRSGEANFNINDDFEEGTIFYNPESTNKKDQVAKTLKSKVLSGEIKDNITGLKLAMSMGCEPKLFTSVIKSLEKEKKLERTGDKNYGSTNIHKVKKYGIKLN